MKRCPECRRDYYDDSLLYCLDDGTALVDGPRTDETSTAILNMPEVLSEAPTKPIREADVVTESLSPVATGEGPVLYHFVRKEHWLLTGFIAVLVVGAFFVIYRYYSLNDKQAESKGADTSKSTPKPYWQMTGAEQLALIKERSLHVQTLIGDEPAEIDEDAQRAIKIEIDDYVMRRDSLSQKPFEEGLRAIYGRATQYAPLIIRAYETHKVPSALGLYQAMIESEYHDCPEPISPTGPVGMFQFSRSTAAKYGLKPEDYCDVGKQADAAARHMADLASDFGEGRASSTLGLLSYMQGGEAVRDYLRQLRRRGITERSFWAVFRYREEFQPPLRSRPPPMPLIARGLNYVPRFFAAAIIGETPDAFDLSTPPLTTLRK